MLRVLENATLLARQIQLTAAQDNQQFIRSDRCWTHERHFFFTIKTIVHGPLSSSTSYQHDSTVFKTISPFDFDTMSFQ